ncbi:MAG: glycosyltransferase family 2 protein [Planctomycetota bacterium]
MGVSAVVPVFNGSSTLVELVDRLEKALAAADPKHEIILVDDGSSDDSWEVVRRLADERERVIGVELMRNHGQHSALLCGIRKARHDIIVTLDDDLQNPPEEIPRLLERLTPELDVVYGYPRSQRHSAARVLASRVTKLVLRKAMGADTATKVSSFRALRAQLRDAFSSFDGPYVNIDVLLTWSSQRFAAVEVDHRERGAGTSNYTVRQFVSHALNMMTGFSALPLRIASTLGFVFTVFGIALLLFVLIRFFITGSQVPGFPFLASSLAIFSGVQLFAIGIIGEYLARIHFRSMDRPSYAVRQVIGGEHEGGEA